MSKPISSLAPSVEQRLSAWENIQYRLGQPPARRIRPTLTISRQFGCEGFPLAERMKELMEAASGEPWNIYDKTLIEKVSEDEGISLRLLKNLGDMSRAIESLGLYSSAHVTHDEAFAKVAKCLVEIAQVGNAILVGRGGAILCKGMANCFHVRLVAGLEWRTDSIARRLALSPKEAGAMVRENSKLREKFISERLDADVTDPAHYDAIFNNERHDVEAIARAVLAYMKSAWSDPVYFTR